MDMYPIEQLLQINTKESHLIDVNQSSNVVAENAQVGDEVGIEVSLKDGTDAIFNLVNDSNGKFDINSETGIVTLASSLNYEDAQNHQIVVSASTDSETFENTFTVSVSDVNEFDISSIIDSDQSHLNQVPANARHWRLCRVDGICRGF